MADEQDVDKADAASVVTMMTTEHFTLQTARSATISDANGRSSLFLSSTSAVSVALAFIGQVSNVGEPFIVFSLVLLPSLYFLGLVTFARTLETAIEDTIYARGINRIRHFYQERAPQLKSYFILSANDDMPGTLSSIGITPSNIQTLFTTAGMIAVINSIIASVFAGLVVRGVIGVPMLAGIVAGIIVFGLSLMGLLFFQLRR